ncbi:vomeronasal type-2 receptor 26-like [Tiliqua scincoides]|uniref:vomeronasal type-2 receptor 26-like n=1 Tax=Tiliqua scincoides TaxID=71010 RepID=UPI0034625769
MPRLPFLDAAAQTGVVTKNYQHILALAFAVKEINETPQILPNITLGFYIYESYFNEKFAYYDTIQFTSTPEKFIPNYKCDAHSNVLAVIMGLNFQSYPHAATLLDLYKIPQLIYGYSPLMNDKTPGLPLYQMVPDEELQYVGIRSLLLHFKWMWIGVLARDNEPGEVFVQNALLFFSQSGICFAFIERVPRTNAVGDLRDLLKSEAKMYDRIIGNQTNVVLVCGESFFTMSLLWFLYLVSETKRIQGKVWIITAQMEFTSLGFQGTWNLDLLNGAMSFSLHSSDPPGFHQFLESINPSSMIGDGFIRDFWETAFQCVFRKTVTEKMNCSVCIGQEKLESLPQFVFDMSMTGHSYSIYNAAHAVAHALHAMSSSRRMQGAKMDDEKRRRQNQQSWQLHPFLRSVSFNNSAGEKVSFDHNGQLVAGLDINNWIISPNQFFRRVKIGMTYPTIPPDKGLSINENTITWHRWFNQVQPVSLCNDHCYPGSIKKMKEGEPSCCYDCIPCPEGQISNQVGLVLGTFMKHHQTPIVKANNQNITYILLIALLLCFLCAFLFIGRPEKWTCLLRQTAFGIIFSVAVSCVLAKTITVVLAFTTTKPGSRMKMRVGKRMATSIVLSCSLIQAGICTVWLATSPPFPEADYQSVVEEILLQCNEGSITMFYSVLSYMGFLASVSFLIAFLARSLPDSFNEAKLITFSMLVFCSVWLSFVPTYLSAKGKHMVAVEIFSILASSTGLLGCIFFPKCYIVLLKPELNKREQLIRRNN